jgi:hypothetical protein
MQRAQMKGGTEMNHTHRTLVSLVSAFAVLLSANLVCAGEGDSPLEAYFLPHDTPLTGAIGAEFAADYYKVIVPATGRFVARLYDINLNDLSDQLHMSLLRTTQNSVGTGYTIYENLVAQSTNDSTIPEVIDIPDLARGIYFLRVWPERYFAWSEADYKIRTDFTVFPPVVPDDIGDEKRYALPIVNQLPTIATISAERANDIDYFECHVPYNTDLTLSLTEINPAGDVDMEVYTAWDVLIGSATEAGSSDELLYLQDLAPGQYFVRLFGKSATQYKFTARKEFTKATDIRDDVGDSLAHAMPLLPGNPSVFCLQTYNGESDVFSVYQPEDGPFIVDVYNMFLYDTREDLSVRVLDEYGNVLAESDNGTLVPEHIEVNLSRGQYFIALYGEEYFAFTGAIYTINVETAGQDVGDAFNQAMQIHAIPYGSETYGYPYIGMIDGPGDADFFQVLLKDKGFVYLTLDRMLHTNVDAQLFDARHVLLKTSASLGTSPEEIYVDGLDAGVYFIKVYSPDEGPGQYRLTPTIGTPTSVISDDIGDEMPRAFPLVPYRRVSGYFWGDNTSDYFTFTLDALNAAVSIHVSNQHVWDAGHEDIRLYVYDESGVQIGFSDNDTLEDELVELSNLEAGTYFVRIDPEKYFSMSPVQYDIVVETDAAPLPSAGLYVPDDLEGVPGEIVYVPVFLDNSVAPVEVSSVSVGIQFDASILEPLGVGNSELTLGQADAQVRFASSDNTISVSVDNFSTVESGALLDLIFMVRPEASIGSASTLTMLTPTLNGAIVPGTDGLVTVVIASR